MQLYLTFNKSFYDNDELNRNEFYSIQRLDGSSWVSLNTIAAYGQDTYTTVVATLENMVDIEFRVIASMDEGTFISNETAFGMSIDNFAILGCTDIEACNYYPDAEVDDGTCLYNDCLGECGGEAFIDECGECDGDNNCFDYLDDGYYSYIYDGEGSTNIDGNLEDVFLYFENDSYVFNFYDNYSNSVIVAETGQYYLNSFTNQFCVMSDGYDYTLRNNSPSKTLFFNKKATRDLEGYYCFDSEFNGESLQLEDCYYDEYYQYDVCSKLNLIQQFKVV